MVDEYGTTTFFHNLQWKLLSKYISKNTESVIHQGQSVIK